MTDLVAALDEVPVWALWCTPGDKAAAYNLLAGFTLCNTGRRMQEIPFHAHL